MAEIESRDDEVTIRLTRVEAAALATIAEHGLRVSEALGLIRDTSAAERGLNRLRAASKPRGR